MEEWKPITKRQKREIVFSIGGPGYRRCMNTTLFALPFFLYVSFNVGKVVVQNCKAAMNPADYLYVSDFDMALAYALFWGIVKLWLMMTTISYWYAVIIRWIRVQFNTITYQYCEYWGSIPNKWGMSDYYVSLEDGKEYQGYLLFCDGYDSAFSDDNKNMIAYKKGNSDKIYLSYLKKNKKYEGQKRGKKDGNF
ncbi:MAG: hypothetical protein IJX63_04275 [Lachnospiraceae bacterium]|nr:hypothetical protein [Lachnospiraceae bacterium]